MRPSPYRRLLESTHGPVLCVSLPSRLPVRILCPNMPWLLDGLVGKLPFVLISRLLGGTSRWLIPALHDAMKADA